MLVLRSHIGYPSPDFTDSPKAHGDPFPPEEISRTKEILGIPPTSRSTRPTDVVDAYRARVGARGARRAQAWQSAGSTPGPVTAAEWDACWAGRALAGLGGQAADVRGRREDRHPPGHPEGAQRHARAPSRGCCRAPATSPATPAPSSTAREHQSAEHPDGRQIHYGIREHAMGVGHERHGLPRRRAPRRRHVLRVQRLPAARRCAWPRCPRPRTSSSSPTTRSGSARTGRPTSRSSSSPRCGPSPACRSSARPTPTRRPRRGGSPSTTTAPPRSILTRQNIPVVTDGSAVEPGAAVVRAVDDPAARPDRHRQRGRRLRRRRRRAWPADGIAARVVSMPSWDRFERPARGVPGRRAARPACPCSRSRRPPRSGGSAGPTTSSASTASAPARRARWPSTSSASTSDHVVARALALVARRSTREEPDGPTPAALRGARSEPLARQPHARLPHDRPAGHAA